MTDYRAWRAVTALAGGVGIVASAAGCGVLDGGETAEPFGLELLVSESREIGGMDALVRGRLADVGGCVGLVADKERYLVVWPRGTEATADEVVIDEQSFRLGDDVRGAGGYLSDRPSYFPSIPTACAEAAADEVIELDALAEVRPAP